MICINQFQEVIFNLNYIGQPGVRGRVSEHLTWVLHQPIYGKGG